MYSVTLFTGAFVNFLLRPSDLKKSIIWAPFGLAVFATFYAADSFRNIEGFFVYWAFFAFLGWSFATQSYRVGTGLFIGKHEIEKEVQPIILADDARCHRFCMVLIGLTILWFLTFGEIETVPE